MISGTRKTRLLFFTAAAGIFLAGCQQSQEMRVAHAVRADQLIELAPKQPPDRVNNDPIVIDDAMAARNWPVTPAVYPNFSSTAGPAEVTFITRPTLNPYERMAIATPLFVANVLLTPLAMLQTPPWEQLEATSLYLPPTYTANPPLEPRGRDDYSGGTGIGYTPAPGRAAPFPAIPAPVQ